MTTDIQADSRGPDRGESEALMESLLIGEGSRHRGELTDLAVELAARSSGFRHGLPDGVLTALADLVRAMDCYYSNLIEGHVTHPVDIERALNNDYSPDVGTRTLQLEARAHVAVQQWIDAGGLRGRATTTDAILSVAAAHHRLLWTHRSATATAVSRGSSRTRCCSTRSTPAQSGPRPADWPRAPRPTRRIWPTAIHHAGTTSTASVISARRPWPGSRGSSFRYAWIRSPSWTAWCSRTGCERASSCGRRKRRGEHPESSALPG